MTIQTCTPLGEVKKTLQRLKDQGYALGLLTNDSAVFTQHALDTLDIALSIDVAISADLGFGGKPETGGMFEALRVMGAQPEQAVTVGDTRTDIEVAKRARLRHFIGISEQYPERTPPLADCPHIVADISGLLKLLPRLD